GRLVLGGSGGFDRARDAGQLPQHGSQRTVLTRMGRCHHTSRSLVSDLEFEGNGLVRSLYMGKTPSSHMVRLAAATNRRWTTVTFGDHSVYNRVASVNELNAGRAGSGGRTSRMVGAPPRPVSQPRRRCSAW